MLYMWCLSQKWKRKLQHFWTLKKKKITKRKKKKLCYSYLVYAKNEEKELQHFWSFLEKKITNIEKKGFHLYVVMGKK